MLRVGLLFLVGPVLGLLQALETGESIPNKYIITLRPQIPEQEITSHLSWVSSVHRRSLSKRDTTGLSERIDIGGFHAYVGEYDSTTITEILSDSNVATIEPEVLYHVTSAVQTDAPWGLAHIASRRLRPSVAKRSGYLYEYDESAGEGSWAYVLDTGIAIDNSDFEGRAVRGESFVPEEEFTDLYGHGTHVAGTIASKTYGVAKKANLVDVKVATKTGASTASMFLQGLDWAVKNITGTPGRAPKSVINSSLAYPTSSAINAAVEAAYAAGIISVVSAGNNARDASKRSPGAAPSAITVGAISIDNTRPSWSNFGPLVDIFAPGEGIVSLSLTEGGSATKEGTSMSCPHVTGLVCYLRAFEQGLEAPANITQRVKQLGLQGVFDAGAGSPNLRAYHGSLPSRL